MKLVACTRSSLQPQSFSVSGGPWGQCCVRSSLYKGHVCRTCSGVCGLAVSHGQSTVRVTDQAIQGARQRNSKTLSEEVDEEQNCVRRGGRGGWLGAKHCQKMKTPSE